MSCCLSLTSPRLRRKATELVHSFYSVLVSVFVVVVVVVVIMALSTVFHSINSSDNSPLFRPHGLSFTWWGYYSLCP